MDNASFHRAPELQAMIQILGRELLFLPPYSPELNPIELSYSWLKREVKVLGVTINYLKI